MLARQEELSGRRPKDPRESAWDTHGSHRWTYFNEGIKQRIEFFLSERLHGRNLDVGGGWYLSYPNSAVVDMSSVCLDYNPAAEKVKFDLDKISRGKKLPFPDHSFDSATFISSWQYLKHPASIVREMERVIVPGGEIYIINGQGAGLDGYIVGPTRSREIAQYFQERGYDTVIEAIPNGTDTKGFQSVCVALPEQNIFGETISHIKQKPQRRARNVQVVADPTVFSDGYIDFEVERIARNLRELLRYPISEYSRQYLKRVEEFSRFCFEKTGKMPIITTGDQIQIEFDMATPEKPPYALVNYFTPGYDAEYRALEKKTDRLGKRFGLNNLAHGCMFRFESEEAFIDYCRQLKLLESDRKDDFGKYIYFRGLLDFIADTGLNSYTRTLQQKVFNALLENNPDLEKQIKARRGERYYKVVSQLKQRRGIDSLTREKTRAQASSVAGTGIFPINEALLAIRSELEKDNQQRPTIDLPYYAYG
jgi:SAM-dependent methyltransferase